jgi:hypothetical protein
LLPAGEIQAGISSLSDSTPGCARLDSRGGCRYATKKSRDLNSRLLFLIFANP